MTSLNSEHYLANWATLNERLSELDEEQAWELLAAEKKGLDRIQFKLRIYGRANKLRTTRERAAL